MPGAPLLALVVLAPTVALGAGSGGDVLVASAVSLREPLEEIARAFEAASPPGANVQLAFGASNALASQIRAGAPIDVLVSADERIAARLAREGLVGAPRVVARNALVVVQRRDLAPALARPEDLASERVRRVAIPDYAVPVGYYARRWLEGRGLLGALGDRIVATEHARATLVAVDRGHVDAAVVYATDARLARSAVIAFAVPPAEHPPIAYVACRVLASAQPQRADAFLEALGQAAAREALLRAGFLPAGP